MILILQLSLDEVLEVPLEISDRVSGLSVLGRVLILGVDESDFLEILDGCFVVFHVLVDQGDVMINISQLNGIFAKLKFPHFECIFKHLD